MVSLATFFSGVVLANGSVAMFGDNSVGQLGNGNNIDSNVPLIVKGLIEQAALFRCGGASSGIVY